MVVRKSRSVWVQSLHGSRKSGYRVYMAVRKVSVSMVQSLHGSQKSLGQYGTEFTWQSEVWVQSLHGSEEIGSKETGSEDQTVHMRCTHFLGGFL